ncbi:MAG TPA: lipase maturation factor family protein [bacterium]|nr:lipase maturation factor family protein [bacterium]
MPVKDQSTYQLTRFCFQRALAFIYLIAFVILVNQFRPLLGENGLLPVPLLVKRITFLDSPSLFWFHYSDRLASILAWSGVVLSSIALSGFSEKFGMWISSLVWFLLWVIYLSFVNVGQVFYGFGWESILLETGFLAIFLGSSDTPPPKVVFWLLRWVLFRVMFGAGLIKLRGDACWRDLTCMVYHYETQPVPNPLSWYFHWLPTFWHKAEILFTHFVELVIPWGFFAPGVVGYFAGGMTILFQIILILSGNLSWLNYMTIILCIPCFDDACLSKILGRLKMPRAKPAGNLRKGILISLTGMIALLSIPPAVNLFSPNQMMNASFNPLHLVNTYGAFGSVTRTRMEVILEGTDDEKLTGNTGWREYEFKCKPGNVRRAPCLMSPYHYRLDWQIWFAAMSSFRYHPWILNLSAKLLEGDPQTLSLLAYNPFPEKPPKYIRASLYAYHFTDSKEMKKTGNWWRRTYEREYLPPLSLDNPRFTDILRQFGWRD